ncbi:MAG: hypothetical protein PVI86_11855 [Phycisphaerae bacterium]|jgi:hypothetical protein
MAQFDRGLVVPAEADACLIDPDDAGLTGTQHLDPGSVDETEVRQAFCGTIGSQDPLHDRHLTRPQIRHIQSNHNLASLMHSVRFLPQCHCKTRASVMRLCLRIKKKSLFFDIVV